MDFARWLKSSFFFAMPSLCLTGQGRASRFWWENNFKLRHYPLSAVGGQAASNAYMLPTSVCLVRHKRNSFPGFERKDALRSLETISQPWFDITDGIACNCAERSFGHGTRDATDGFGRFVGAGGTAYDCDPLRERLADQGIELLSPHRKNRTKPPRNDGRKMRRYARRYVIERTNSWLHSFRRIANRWEHYSFMYHGFVRLACILIAVGPL